MRVLSEAVVSESLIADPVFRDSIIKIKMSRVEETLNRINTHKGVMGIILVDSKGIAIKSTMDQNKTIEYGSLISNFLANAMNWIKSLHKDEEIQFIRIRSYKHEIMIAPDQDFSLIVLQVPDKLEE